MAGCGCAFSSSSTLIGFFFRVSQGQPLEEVEKQRNYSVFVSLFGSSPPLVFVCLFVCFLNEYLFSLGDSINEIMLNYLIMEKTLSFQS